MTTRSGSPAVYNLRPRKEKIGNVTRMTLRKKSLTRNETETKQGQRNNISKFKNITSKVLIRPGSPAVYNLRPRKEKIGNVTKMTLRKKSLTRNETETNQGQRNNISKFNNITSKVLIRPGSPAVYKLIPKVNAVGTVITITLGTKDTTKLNKTVLLVGETGTGKTTLINALVNYTVGVEWEDNVWFEIVEETTKRQCVSQTSDVIVYEIFGFEGKTLPYSLTIIDTPGYGDTGGNEHDDIVSQRLLELFRSEGGVHEINAVGLVLKAAVNRLDDRQSYIFNSVLSLFGRNMADSIVALITHSPGRKPKNVLGALEAAKFKCAKDAKGQPVYFLFDNCQTEDREDDPDSLEHADRITTKGMRQFADFLSKSEPKSLQVTVEVINERLRLNACIENLKKLDELIENKQREIQRSDGNSFLRVFFPGLSSVFFLMDKYKHLDESFQHVVRLEQIALNADSLSTHIHLDFLIKMMEERRDAEKIQKLKEMKGRVDYGIEAGMRYMRP